MVSKTKQSGLNAAMHTSGLYSDMSLDGPEIGTLVIVVDRAKNLPNRRSMGKQDPYCAARLAKEAKKTSTDRRGGQTPKWDQELRFAVRESPDYLTLKLSVFNDDKKTELIGEGFLKLDDVIVPGGGEAELWYTLHCKGKYAGEIRLELTYYDSRPKIEKPVPEGIRGRHNSESPALNGPRQTPVRRRPLPSDPGLVGSSPSTYHTPPPQQHAHERTSGSNRRTAYNQEQPRPVEYQPHSEHEYGYRHQSQEDPFIDLPARLQQGSSPYSHVPMDLTHQRGYSDSHLAYAEPSQDLPYPVSDGPPDTFVSHSRQTSRFDDSALPRPLPHSNSEPLVTHHAHQNLGYALHHTVSESQVQGLSMDHRRQYQTLQPQHEHPEVYAEPEEFQDQDHFESPVLRSHSNSYSHIQPDFEERGFAAPPPPPPMHGNSTPSSAERARLGQTDHPASMTPAPLRITAARANGAHDMYSSPPSLRAADSSRYTGSPHGSNSSRMYGRSAEGDYSPSPRPSLGERAVLGQRSYDNLDMSSSLHGSPPDVNRSFGSPSHRHSLPHLGSSPTSHVQQTSAYRTPPRGTHPLATEQVAAYSSSPSAAFQNSPADAPPAPLIKPRPVSPAAELRSSQLSDTRPGVNVNFVRKSVAHRPASRDTDFSTPFSPDSFDALNPHAMRFGASGGANHSGGGSPYSTPPRASPSAFNSVMQPDQSVRQSPYNAADHVGGPIHDLHGNVIDPSDRLPVDSWAPEPERKGFSFKPQITARERDRLNGARSMGTSSAGSFTSCSPIEGSNDAFSVSSRSDVGSHVSVGSSLLSTIGGSGGGSNNTSGGGRNRLQKRNRPQSAAVRPANPLHGPGPMDGAGNYPYVNASAKRSSYDVRHAVGGAGPSIPAKLPLGDMDRLNQEMSSIDIGLGGGGAARRTRRFGD